MNKSRTIQLVIAGKDRVSKMLKRITGTLKRWGVGALKITGGLVAGFGAVTVALGAMFAKLSASIDEQAKMASALGLSNEQLGVMRDAAGYAGISVSQLDTALRKMSQSVADAADGTGEAKDALEELGLDAEKLQQMGPEKAFKAIVDRLDQIPNGIKKTQMAMDIFGKSGAAMANLTSDGLKQAQKDADTLGLKLSSAQAANVEASNDAWSRIKNVAADFLKFITARLAPGVKAGLDKAFDFIKKQDLQAWATKAAKGIGVAFQAVAVILGGVAEAVIAISRGLAGAVSIVNTLTKDSLGKLLQRHVDQLERIKTKISELRNVGGSGGQEMRDLVGQQEVKYRSIRDTMSALKSADEVRKITDSISKSLESAQGFTVSKEALAAMDTLSGLVSDVSKNTVSGAKAEVAAINSVTSALDRRLEKERQINAEQGKSGGTFNIASFANDLDDEADK